jgi:hypothetical protein
VEEIVMIQTFARLLLVVLAVLVMPACGVVMGIFKAGVGVGVFMAVVVVGLIFFLVTRTSA